ncbi:hypothetical protein Rhow_007020 [Rhodococcus wratislaviensis]|uniref:Uncharacterized protein n=1 Tax=Rhodococcus wratislaviensis TaxID=44752 RepID=A0A402CH05_RHOWR|nr:hypothetical protein Rhow_007020 [Rhodococcus wratislaviensis]
MVDGGHVFVGADTIDDEVTRGIALPRPRDADVPSRPHSTAASRRFPCGRCS